MLIKFLLTYFDSLRRERKKLGNKCLKTFPVWLLHTVELPSLLVIFQLFNLYFA